jgi:hypothetical protein
LSAWSRSTSAAYLSNAAASRRAISTSPAVGHSGSVGAITTSAPACITEICARGRPVLHSTDTDSSGCKLTPIRVDPSGSTTTVV